MNSDFAPLLGCLERRFTGIVEQLTNLKQDIDTLRNPFNGHVVRNSAEFEGTVALLRKEACRKWQLQLIADSRSVIPRYYYRLPPASGPDQAGRTAKP